MAEKKIEEHEHVRRETDEGTQESHHDRVVEKDEAETKPKTTTVEEETTIKKDD